MKTNNLAVIKKEKEKKQPTQQPKMLVGDINVSLLLMSMVSLGVAV